VSSFVHLQAQVVEESKAMSLGVHSAMAIEFPDVEKTFVEKLWRRYMKTFDGQTKKVKRSEEWHTQNAAIAEISGEKALDLYIQTDAVDGRVAFYLWVALSDVFISASQFPQESMEAEKLLMRFGLYIAKESTRRKLEQEETALRQLKTNLKRLERDDERYHREIEKARQRIVQAENNLEKNTTEQQQTRKLIQLQKQAIESVKKKLDSL